MPPTHPPYKQLQRPTTDRMVAGVASGLGRYFNVDPTLVRVIFAVVAVLTGGLALLAYPIMWFIIPEEPSGAPAWPQPTAAAPGAWPHAAAPAPAGPYATAPAPAAWPHPAPSEVAGPSAPPAGPSSTPPAA